MNKAFIPELKNSGRALLYGLAGNPLQTIGCLFLVALALGALIFYRYDFLAEFSEPAAFQEPVQFQKELYDQVLGEWQARDERFAGAGSQNYIDPFSEKRPGLILKKN